MLAATLTLCGQAQDTGFVTTRGTEIVTPDGKPLLLRGINLGNWLNPEGYMFRFDTANSASRINDVFSELIGPDEAVVFWQRFRERYITREDIRFIRDLGLNSVRVPFNYKLFTPEEHPGVWLETGFTMLDSVVTWCREQGLYVIFDMHCAPGGQSGANIDDSRAYPFLFTSEASQERTAELWRRIAHRYADETTVIGYDLLNEPIDHYFEKEGLNPSLEPLYRRIVAAIRSVDPNHIVFLGGGRWNTDFSVFGQPFDEKAVYTFHKYWMPPVKTEIQEYIDFRDTFNVPVWMGESGENTHAWIDSFRTVLEANNIGWCFWTYKRLETDRSMVSIPLPESWDLISRYADGPRVTFFDIMEHRLPKERAASILTSYLDNLPLARCRVNDGYLRALGVEGSLR